jgi:hypothetical protein
MVMYTHHHHNTALIPDMQSEYQGAVPSAMPVQKLLSASEQGMARSEGLTVTGTRKGGGKEYNIM